MPAAGKNTGLLIIIPSPVYRKSLFTGNRKVSQGSLKMDLKNDLFNKESFLHGDVYVIFMDVVSSVSALKVSSFHYGKVFLTLDFPLSL